MQINRLTAYKTWISDLINNDYIEGSGEFESNYILFKDKKISRVNIIASVVDKNESENKNYLSLLLDDGTEQIRIKTWNDDTKLIGRIYVGDVILVIGKLKRYNDQIYILPEIIKNLDINWETARKLELLKLYGKPGENKFINSEDKLDVEEISFNSSNLRNEIINLIEKYEDKSGITLEEIKSELKARIDDINNALDELIKEGQVYLINDKFRLLR